MKAPKMLAKKELTMFGNNLSKIHGAATNQHELATKSKNEQAINLAKSALDNVTATSAQLDELQKLIDGLDGKGAIHFRVFYQTEDGPIDLLVTEENAPASEVPADKPAAADAAK
jgi:hypothetical protein